MPHKNQRIMAPIRYNNIHRYMETYRNSKNKRVKCMFYLLCVILIIFSCADKKNRYGVNFNNQRSIIKLPLLNSSWKYAPSYTSDGGTWVNPLKKTEFPVTFKSEI